MFVEIPLKKKGVIRDRRTGTRAINPQNGETHLHVTNFPSSRRSRVYLALFRVPCFFDLFVQLSSPY